LFEFIAIAEGLTARTILLYLAIAAAVLTKGPIGAALPVIVAAVWIVLFRRWDLLARLRLLRGALIVGIIGGGWYFAAIAAGGMDFVRKQILAENLYRLFHHGGFHEGHAHPFYYEDVALLAGFLPWSPVAIAAAVQYPRGPRKMDARFGYLLVWFLTILIFYNLPQSKRGVYLLALYPALSAITAILMCDAIDIREGIAGWIKWLSRGAGAVFAAAGVGAFAGLAMLRWWTAPLSLILGGFDIHAAGLIPALAANARHFLVLAIALPAATAAIGVYLMRTRPLAEKLVAGIAGGLVCVALAVNLVVEPGTADAVATKDFAARTIALANGAPVGYFGSLDYGFAFYSGRNVDFVSPRDPAAPALIVCPEDDWNLVGPDVRNRFEIILRSPPTNLDGTSPLLLLRRLARPPAAAPPAPPAAPGPRGRAA
jgi:4-amino-4-deoxy-L-arabinose transferase-like glycosyltransferase